MKASLQPFAFTCLQGKILRGGRVRANTQNSTGENPVKNNGNK
jgi:hypothetical protein